MPEGSTATIQWNRSATANGPYTPIPNANLFTYRLTTDDLGQYIQVNATGTGSYTGFVNSTAVGPVTRGLTSVGITGTPYVDSLLTNTTVLPAGATVNIQWNRSASANGPWTPIS